MLKISEIIRGVVLDDDSVSYALGHGFLNLSAYSKYIRSVVSAKAKKPVKTGTITVALSRLQPLLNRPKNFWPKIELQHLSVTSSLCELAYPKTTACIKYIGDLYAEPKFHQSNFFAITAGVNEVAIICPEKTVDMVKKIFGKATPKLIKQGLAAITITFDEKYLVTPNFIYILIRTLAVRRINIVEIVSTFTELSFIVAQEDTVKVFEYLNEMLKPQESY